MAINQQQPQGWWARLMAWLRGGQRGDAGRKAAAAAEKAKARLQDVRSGEAARKAEAAIKDLREGEVGRKAEAAIKDLREGETGRKAKAALQDLRDSDVVGKARDTARDALRDLKTSDAGRKAKAALRDLRDSPGTGDRDGSGGSGDKSLADSAGGGFRRVRRHRRPETDWVSWGGPRGSGSHGRLGQLGRSRLRTAGPVAVDSRSRGFGARSGRLGMIEAESLGLPSGQCGGYAERGNPGGGGRVQVADGGSVVMHCHLTCANDSANVNPG
jgi:hypothetical protein